ncbi:MAG: PD-(D/E)XK nuclease family protein, partial [Clostridiales bacterium]|nr:PD-(D/E)XK nuclease family protein [Clostridiales bacterium]
VPPRDAPAPRDAVFSALAAFDGSLSDRDAAVHMRTCQTRDAQYRYLTGEVLRLLASGTPPEDIAILADPSAALLGALTEAGIPVNADRREAADRHPLARYWLTLLQLSTKGYDRDLVFDLVKNPFFAEDTPEFWHNVAAFENFCLRYGVQYGRFKEPLLVPVRRPEESENGYRRTLAARAEAERVRLCLAASVPPDFDDCRAVCAHMRAHLSSRAVAARLAALDAQMDAAYHKAYNDQIADVLLAVLDEIDTLAGGRAAADFYALFAAGLAARPVAVIPGRAHAVTVAPAEGFRFTRYAVLLVPDCHDGAFPESKKDCGILSDRDIDALAGKLSATVEPRIREVNDRARDNLFQALSAANTLIFTRAAREDAGAELPPAPLWGALAKAFEGAQVTTEADDLFMLTRAEGGGPDMLSMLFPARADAARYVLAEYGKARAAAEKMVSPAFNTLFAAMDRPALPVVPTAPPPIENAAALFFPHGDATVTAVEDYHRCPYAYFLSRGLKLEARRDDTVQRKDVGIVLHALAEDYGKSVLEGVPFDFDATFTALCAASYPESTADPGFIRRLRAEGEALVAAVKGGLADGDFRLAGVEIKFGGKDCAYPPLKLDAYGTPVQLTGKIDRVDVFGDAVRIIDYKSGRVEFSFSDIYFGLHLQLPAYLGVLTDCNYTPAGAYFLPVRNDYEGGEPARFCMRGMTAADAALVDAMDRPFAAGARDASAWVCLTRDKNGNLTAGAKERGAVLTQNEIRAVGAYTRAVAARAVHDIVRGYLPQSPKTGGCAYCDFLSVCGKRRERKTDVPVSKSAFLCGEEDSHA